MRPTHDDQRQAFGPLADHFRGSFVASIIYNNDLKIRAVRLLSQGMKARTQCGPVIVGAYDNAEERHRMTLGWHTQR